MEKKLFKYLLKEQTQHLIALMALVVVILSCMCPFVGQTFHMSFTFHTLPSLKMVLQGVKRIWQKLCNKLVHKRWRKAFSISAIIKELKNSVFLPDFLIGKSANIWHQFLEKASSCKLRNVSTFLQWQKSSLWKHHFWPGSNRAKTVYCPGNNVNIIGLLTRQS